MSNVEEDFVVGEYSLLGTSKAVYQSKLSFCFCIFWFGVWTW
uniref:Uncharacterized protein n=1 Tax=Rhizophora mucronata TaxID=61149 RepID=A0A2P2NMS2_RHIMU